ncbi:MAG TPA: hypothetical protein VK075_07375 [Pseudogracilibacillus sp.]|nr:hypothetical protein [Pseudogracilibacillus sp.]
MIEASAQQYTHKFKQQFPGHTLKKIEEELELLEETLTYKIYLLLEDEAAKIVLQVPTHFQNGTRAQSQLNELILPQLMEIDDVQLNAVATHLYFENDLNIKKEHKNS